MTCCKLGWTFTQAASENTAARAPVRVSDSAAHTVSGFRQDILTLHPNEPYLNRRLNHLSLLRDGGMIPQGRARTRDMR